MLLPKTLLTICSVGLLGSYALVVPNDVATSIYQVNQRIPIAKKGIDSRLGFGFRLGDHADVQVLLELGPQTETSPLGNQGDDSAKNKRQTVHDEKNQLIRQKKQKEKVSIMEHSAASWLENWSKDIKSNSNQPDKKNQQNEESNLLYTLPMLSSKSFQQLQLLYKMATTIIPTTEEAVRASKEPAANLDDQTMDESLKRKTKLTKELMNVNLEQSL